MIGSPLPQLRPPAQRCEGLCLIHPNVVKTAVTVLTAEQSKNACSFLPDFQSLPSYVGASSSGALILKE